MQNLVHHNTLTPNELQSCKFQNTFLTRVPRKHFQGFTKFCFFSPKVTFGHLYKILKPSIFAHFLIIYALVFSDIFWSRGSGLSYWWSIEYLIKYDIDLGMKVLFLGMLTFSSGFGGQIMYLRDTNWNFWKKSRLIPVIGCRLRWSAHYNLNFQKFCRNKSEKK